MRHALLLFILLYSACSNINALTRPDNTKITLNKQIDSIVVIKHERKMHVYNKGNLLKSYHICLGFTPVGAKHFKDDGKTPEGMYRINGKKPNSICHKA